jgi:hypothetical protein
MSDFHLAQLEAALERSHWNITRRKPGDGYRYSAIWIITRPDGSTKLSLRFDGLDDMETLPVEESYACHLAEFPDVNLYFARKGRSWKERLKQFTNQLEALCI